MSTKTFGLYSSVSENLIKITDELVIEIGHSHMACMVKNVRRDLITSFELFSFEKGETVDFEELFASVLKSSQLIDRTFAQTRLFINTEFALLVPVFKFNKEISSDYLNVIFGEDGGARKQFEHVDTDPDLMNAFRIPQDWFEVVNEHLGSVSIHHSYTKNVRKICSSFSNTQSGVISVTFYPAHLVVAVMIGSTLHFIQSFTYQSSEDIIYFLLNISQRFEMNTHELLLQVSGMIEFHTPLYNDLLKYFRNIAVEDVDKGKVATDIMQHPPHYFAPFFNLAL